MTCCTLSWPEINSKLTRDVSFLHIININATIITQHYSKIVCLVFQKQRLKSQKGFQKVKSAGFWWKGVQKSKKYRITTFFNLEKCIDLKRAGMLLAMESIQLPNHKWHSWIWRSVCSNWSWLLGNTQWSGYWNGHGPFDIGPTLWYWFILF